SATQALASSMAVFLAVWPKMRFYFARPSLRELPIRSYFIVSIMSYVLAVALWSVLYLSRPELPFAQASSVFLSQGGFIPPFLLLPLQAVIFTLFVSVTIDLYSTGRRVETFGSRIAEGVTLGVVTMIFQSFVYLQARGWLKLVFQPVLP